MGGLPISSEGSESFPKIDNPFMGKVKTDLMQLYISRFLSSKTTESSNSQSISNEQLDEKDKYNRVLEILNSQEKLENKFLVLNSQENELCKNVIRSITNKLIVNQAEMLNQEDTIKFKEAHSDAQQIINILGSVHLSI